MGQRNLSLLICALLLATGALARDLSSGMCNIGSCCPETNAAAIAGTPDERDM
jgi:hypothetical protein